MNPLSNLFKDAPLSSFSNGSIISPLNAEKEPCVFYIQYGFVKIYTISEQGDENILIILRRNEMFPIAPLICDGNGQKVFFEALGTTKLFVHTKEYVISRMYSDTQVTKELLKHVCERFLVSSQHIETLSHKDAYHRLVCCLRFLAMRFGHRQGESIFLDPLFTHKLIANTINLTRGTVTKEFKALYANKLVTNDKGRIHIEDIHKLSNEIDEPLSIEAQNKLYLANL